MAAAAKRGGDSSADEDVLPRGRADWCGCRYAKGDAAESEGHGEELGQRLRALGISRVQAGFGVRVHVLRANGQGVSFFSSSSKQVPKVLLFWFFWFFFAFTLLAVVFFAARKLSLLAS